MSITADFLQTNDLYVVGKVKLSKEKKEKDKVKVKKKKRNSDDLVSLRPTAVFHSEGRKSSCSVLLYPVSKGSQSS